MTEQKSTQLSPEEWKQLCITNAQQFVNFLNSVPAQGRASEEDVTLIPGMTPQVIAQIESHLARCHQFLMAWARSRPAGFVQPAPQQEGPLTANGSAPVKKRGGWPKGKSRKAAQAQAQH